LNPLYAVLLGIVEGITEYLPISSTGHLILASRFLGLAGAGSDAFDVVIQLGAILAVAVQYRTLLWSRAKGLATWERASVSLLASLVLGFVPTAIAGLLFRKTIKKFLFGSTPVAMALIVGGVLMLIVEAWRSTKQRTATTLPVHDSLDDVTPWRAFLIGLGQCVSLCPGASRSMCTIVAGQLTGLTTATAAEFSFLLGLPTLSAATLYEGYKSRDALLGVGALNVALGLSVSFLVAWAVIRGFVAYLKSKGLAPFGVYRVALGVLVLILFAR
jgi:undecaprenyl-diphosphatase